MTVWQSYLDSNAISCSLDSFSIAETGYASIAYLGYSHPNFCIFTHFLPANPELLPLRSFTFFVSSFVEVSKIIRYIVKIIQPRIHIEIFTVRTYSTFVSQGSIIALMNRVFLFRVEWLSFMIFPRPIGDIFDLMITRLMQLLVYFPKTNFSMSYGTGGPY